GLPSRGTRQVVDGARTPFLNRAVCRGNSVPRGADRNLSLPSRHLALYSHTEHRLGFRPRPPGERLALRLRADARAGHASTSPETYGGRSLSGGRAAHRRAGPRQGLHGGRAVEAEARRAGKGGFRQLRLLQAVGVDGTGLRAPPPDALKPGDFRNYAKARFRLEGSAWTVHNELVRAADVSQVGLGEPPRPDADEGVGAETLLAAPSVCLAWRRPPPWSRPPRAAPTSTSSS